jgi:hypothetical protein
MATISIPRQMTVSTVHLLSIRELFIYCTLPLEVVVLILLSLDAVIAHVRPVPRDKEPA